MIEQRHLPSLSFVGFKQEAAGRRQGRVVRGKVPGGYYLDYVFDRKELVSA